MIRPRHKYSRFDGLEIDFSLPTGERETNCRIEKLSRELSPLFHVSIDKRSDDNALNFYRIELKYRLNTSRDHPKTENRKPSNKRAMKVSRTTRINTIKSTRKF